MADDGASVAVEERSASAGRGDGLLAIRRAQPDDFEVIKPLVEEYHRESRYGHIPFSEHKLQRRVTRVINSPDTMLAAYVRHCGRAVGIVHANAGDYYYAKVDAWSRCKASTWPKLSG